MGWQCLIAYFLSKSPSLPSPQVIVEAEQLADCSSGNSSGSVQQAWKHWLNSAVIKWLSILTWKKVTLSTSRDEPELTHSWQETRGMDGISYTTTLWMSITSVGYIICEKWFIVKHWYWIPWINQHTLNTHTLFKYLLETAFTQNFQS